MSIDWIVIGKIALAAYLTVAVLALAIRYFRRRRSGVTPWRPSNSLIIGYDAPRTQIEQPASPARTDSEPFRHKH